MCGLESLECIHAVRSVTSRKRALPDPPIAGIVAGTIDAASTPPQSTTPPPRNTDKILIISAATCGSLLLVIALTLFYICIKRRNAARRRIGQLQEFAPAFLDDEKPDKYYQTSGLEKMSSLSTRGPSPPCNVHHRTRSAPVAFAKSIRKNSKSSVSKDRHHADREPSGPFQQISLAAEDDGFVESEDELALQRSLSTAVFRNRASTISVPNPILSTLHRSVSLNSHTNTGYISRSPPIDEEHAQDPQDADALPTATNLRFEEGENLSGASKTRDLVQPNRFSASMAYHTHRGSFSSAMEFDPSRFSTSSVMFDSKQLFPRSGRADSDDEDSDDASSSSSADGFDHLPPHQKPQSFETHHLYTGSGDKQDLLEDERVDPMQQQSSHPHYSQHAVDHTAPAVQEPTLHDPRV
ncbi:hypothetical protein BGZ70_002925 [Mortierella alpina]|uniref:Uncharacterized protein n=1 Tax=Mortierella alpina TaxID=64518 RepID=A0A9P6M5F0_MORAP|nr:hypothetical protein BGZ70_002925 [Mortierella alpina]